MSALKFLLIKFGQVGVVIAALFTANLVNAGTLTGGQFSLTYDSPADLLAGMTTGPGAPTSWYLAGFFPKAVADPATVTQMINTPTFATPATLDFEINPSNLAGTGIPTGGVQGGRNNQVTSLTWGPSQDALVNSPTFSATGQVGLDGVIMTRGSFTGSLLSGDYKFAYDPLRETGGNSGWVVRNNVSFGSNSFDTRNLSVTTQGDSLIMSGDLWLSPNTSAFVLKTDGIINAGKVGSFTLTSPVPLPGAVWLFGSGIVGLIGVCRRKARASN